ncbi:hypothetical protein DEU56DRAFT_914034 [Suillus clintonianus]|uniref:uncharacterized protein n=1 Tax=Suillus clintonianus TaxID=1904413 RepID=UPI001B87CCD4|nr:uncharacterized protein DEU56DRAFT_914034 [Suillus clintonianus]KAG2133009.1 hypothetical protein DEU56DRAFT_914034 [Suillus clintonianus]
MAKNKKEKNRSTKSDYATYHKTEVFCKCSECTGECGPKGKSIPKWKEREHRKKEGERKKAPRMRSESIKTIETLAAHQIMQQPEAGPSRHVVEATHHHPFRLSEPPELHHSPSPQQLESAPDMDVDDFDIGESWNDLPDVGSAVPSIERMIGETSGVSASGDSAPEPQLTTLRADDDFADDLYSVDIDFIPDDGQDDVMFLDGGHNGSQALVVPTQTHNPQMHLEDATTHETTVEGELVLELPRPPSVVLAAASPHWFWKITLLLIAWLNLHYHLPHLACTLILKITRHILVGLTVLAPDEKVAGSLNTVFNHLDIKDNFDIHPVCPVCHRIYPHDSQGDAKCLNCSEPLFEPSASRTKPRPCLQCPQNPLLNAILRLLSHAGIEEELDAWHHHVPEPGKRASIQDGEIWKTIKGNDGELFFDNSPERPDKDELRIGITLGFDGFGYQRSRNAGTHSSGILSNCIVNLPTHLRYRPQNLMVFGITPGPKEFDSDELQFFMKNYVDNLISLYENGIVVKMPNYPNGRRVRMILVAVCALCHIKRSELKTRDAMDYDKFPPRYGEEHTKRAQEYLDLDDKEREAFFKLHSARYFELSRLKYFDPVRMSVIDPMHSFLLGIIHCHWYDSWIQTNTIRKRTDKNKRELDQIHEYLTTFEMPNWVGRLPEQVGYPSGGSLTSDEWKGLALVFCPIVIPFLWQEWYPKANTTYDKALTSWENRERQRLICLTAGKAKKGDDKPSTKPVPQMHPSAPDNFLKLAAALKIILGRSFRDADIPRAKELLRDYLMEYLELYPDDVKPTHHWVTHIFDQLQDYGPVYNFWTFLFERLNKVLKSYSTNNHSNGEIEVTFMRAFQKDVALCDMLANLNTAPDMQDESSAENMLLLEAVRIILATDGDTRGTVASLAHEMDQAAEDFDARFSLGASAFTTLSRQQQDQLIKFYESSYPNAKVVSRAASTNANDPNFLNSRARTFTHIVVDGHHILPSSSLNNASSSLVQADIGGRCYVGQVMSIISHAPSGKTSPV